MDGDEIEQWYEDEKQMLMEKYTTDLENKRNRDEAATEFNAKMDELMQKYKNSMFESIANNGKTNKLQSFLFSIREKIPFLNKK
ncbi:hypothetical protein ISS07_05865 [Candidatus Woesearchaeota archaeon]|nr:hypothetical protein [Candidatus Woesearchaeota archaeon]